MIYTTCGTETITAGLVVGLFFGCIFVAFVFYAGIRLPIILCTDGTAKCGNELKYLLPICVALAAAAGNAAVFITNSGCFRPFVHT